LSISSLTDGRFYLATNSTQLEERFGEIFDELQNPYVVRWSTLKRTSDFFPLFELTNTALSASLRYIAKEENIYHPSSFEGDELNGRLVFDAAMSDTNVATLILRTSYVPRGVTHIRVRFATQHPYSIQLIPFSEGGVCPDDWRLLVAATNGAGFFEVSSPAPEFPFSSLPFATLGKMVRIDIEGVKSVSECFYDLAVDNDFYETPGGPFFTLEDIFAVYTPVTETPHGTPFWWLNRYGFNFGLIAAELGDSDEDGVPTWLEYLTGTNPTNKQSAFLIRAQFSKVDGCRIGVKTEVGHYYRIDWATLALLADAAERCNWRWVLEDSSRPG
jgi:hypothetical protein